MDQQYRVMKNVTVTLEDEVAEWAKAWAAEHDTSVSQFLGGLLKDRMLEHERYQVAKSAYLARKPKVLKRKGQRYRSRSELYDG